MNSYSTATSRRRGLAAGELGTGSAMAQVLDVFSLRDSVVGEYKNFATSFTTIFADDIREQIEAIYASDRYWPEPLIQINPSYRRTTTVEALARSGLLHKQTADIFRSPAKPDGSPGDTLSLYKHQE